MPNIVHVGYPKTASTFLQQQLFNRFSGVDFMDYRTSEPFFNHLILNDRLDVDYSFLKEGLMLKNDSNTRLYSYESLTGVPFNYRGINRSAIAEQLKELGFNKIIITIRSQPKILDSMYRQYIFQGGTHSMNRFLTNGKSQFHFPFALDYLKYDRLVDLYVSQFGRENVKVICFEKLVHNRAGFAEEICEFLGVTPPANSSYKVTNSSVSNLSIWLMRMLNHFFFRKPHPQFPINRKHFKLLFQLYLDPYFIRFVSSKKSHLSPTMLAEIALEYRQSNAKLMSGYGLDLDRYDYPI